MIPVILLAFANDKRNAGAGYLRGLTTERNAIRDALMIAEQNGLCQVLVEPDVTVDRLFDIFQNSTYRDRIAVFHYGGHAESYSLLLETATGDKASAHSEGLVGFLAKQKSLKLVFLNGCSSQKQSEELVAAGLPAVIGTSQSIDDTIATGLATRFYKGISSGMAIERAWTDAVDQIKTEKGTSNTKVFFTEGILGSPGENQFPWQLYTGEGGVLSRLWNLPEAANHPLFGLELPMSYYRKLPVAPYVGIRSFSRDEAAIFFGRGHDIRKIHTQLSREQPVILLSGKKGVGKSSLLAAGLAPRLEKEFAIGYSNIQGKDPLVCFSDALDQVMEVYNLEKSAPRDINYLDKQIAEIKASVSSTTGFAKEVLERELQQLIHLASKERLTFHEQWLFIEEKTGKSLVVLLDDLPDDPGELNVLLEIMTNIFESEKVPRGKLVVSMDEESRATFCDLLKASGFPFAEIFLQPLTWEGMEEAITGVTHSPVTQEFYRVQIDTDGADNLLATLCGDLADGDTSLVAPYLQVILSALWVTALKEDPKTPAINLQSYQEGIQSGEIMDRFLTMQLDSLKEWKAEPLRSGLALDLLYLHTSTLGKSSILEAGKRKQIYAGGQELINGLLNKCKDLFLLTDTHPEGTTLGHNLLAPVVIRHYSISLSPGQQAARILNSKTAETTEPEKAPWLNETDLETVEKGMKGMRALTTAEEALLALSRAKKLQAEKDRKRRRVIRGMFISAVMLFALLAAWQWRLAEKRFLESMARELAFTAKSVMKKDNTLAIYIAREAYSVLGDNSPPEVMQTLSEIFHSQDEMPFYKSKFHHSKTVNTAVFSPDGNTVLTASEDGFAILWDLNGKEIISLPHDIDVKMAGFSPSGNQILTLTRTHVRLWELNGKETDKDTIPETVTSLDGYSTDVMKITPRYEPVDSSAFTVAAQTLRQETNTVIASPAKNRILVLQDGTGTLYDEKGQLLKDAFVSSVSNATFSGDGKKLMTISPEADLSHIIIWNDAGDSLYNFRGRGENVNAVFSPDGQSILATLNDFTPAANSFNAKLWDLSGAFLHQFPRKSLPMNTVDYFPGGSRYLTASADGSAKIWNANGELIDSLVHDDFVSSAFFSSDGKHIITASRDHTARIWTPTEPQDKQVVVLNHRAEVTSAVFSPFARDGWRVLTASRDSLVRLWSMEGTLVDSFLHPEEIVSRAQFTKGDQQIISISYDSAVTLWDARGDSLHIFRHPDKVFSASFSPDSTRLLTTCSDSLIRLWNMEGMIEDSFRHVLDRPKHAFYTDDGEHIITGGKMVKIWNASTHELVDSLIHPQMVSWIEVSPDGRMILTTCNDRNAYLWNFNGELLAIYQKHTDIINRGFFTPDGSHILTAANDGYIMRWKTPGAIYDELKTIGIARLSREEEERYGIENRWGTLRAIYDKVKMAIMQPFSNR